MTDTELTSMLGASLKEIANARFADSTGEDREIEQVDDRCYLRLPDAGITLDADLDGRIAAVFLRGKGDEGSRGFGGALPRGISFRDSRQSIHRKLGTPSAAGGGNVIKFFGKAPAWDRYDWESYSMHIQYEDGESGVTLVTLMRSDRIPV